MTIFPWSLRKIDNKVKENRFKRMYLLEGMERIIMASWSIALTSIASFDILSDVPPHCRPPEGLSDSSDCNITAEMSSYGSFMIFLKNWGDLLLHKTLLRFSTNISEIKISSHNGESSCLSSDPYSFERVSGCGKSFQEDI